MKEAKKVVLGGRLSLVAEMVRDGAKLADVGTDHALLPVFLVQRGRCRSAIAADIARAPLDRARGNIRAHGLEDKIEVRQCSGLAGIDEGEFDDVVIAGMGGETIAEILDKAPFLKNERYNLVLQPMTRAHFLREYLFGNGFDIKRERVVREEGKLYCVMQVEFDGVVRECSLARLYIGNTDKDLTLDAVEYIRLQGKQLTDRLKGLRIEGASPGEIKRYEQAAGELERILAGEG